MRWGLRCETQQYVLRLDVCMYDLTVAVKILQTFKHLQQIQFLGLMLFKIELNSTHSVSPEWWCVWHRWERDLDYQNTSANSASPAPAAPTPNKYLHSGQEPTNCVDALYKDKVDTPTFPQHRIYTALLLVVEFDWVSGVPRVLIRLCNFSLYCSTCGHIFSANFPGRNPIISTGICVIGSFIWGRKVPHVYFAHVHVNHKNSPHWPTLICLVWKWLLCEMCFIHCYTIDNQQWISMNFANVTVIRI